MYISWIFLWGTTVAPTPTVSFLQPNAAPPAEDSLPAPSDLPTIEDTNSSTPPTNADLPSATGEDKPASQPASKPASKEVSKQSPPLANESSASTPPAKPRADDLPESKQAPAPGSSTDKAFQYQDSASTEQNSLQWAKSGNSPPLFQYTETPQNHDAIKWSSETELQSKTTSTSTSMLTNEPKDRLFTPRRFGLEIKMGPYLPNVDRNCPKSNESCTPFHSIFDSRPNLLVVLGFDWQFLNLAGPVSIGTSIGLWRDSAAAPFRDPSENGMETEMNFVPGKSKTDVTTFNVLPVSLLLGYRLELFANKYHVPLVPFVKGGLAYGIFWSGDSKNRVSTTEAGRRFEGGSLGGQLELGGMVQLDGFEPGASKKLEQNLGVRHVYLFGEYMFSRIDGLKKTKKVSVGDNTWLAGIAFEF